VSGQRPRAGHAFPGEDGQETRFEYVDPTDGGRIKPIVLARSGPRVTVKADALGAGGEVRVRCDARPRGALLNGRRVRAGYDAVTGLAAVAFRADQPVDLTLTLP
jgi:hypothetical protein